MQRHCSPPCRICRSPGPVLCAASARAESEERHEEETDRIHDEYRAKLWIRPAPEPRSYFDPRDPYPCTQSGMLHDDPAVDCR